MSTAARILRPRPGGQDGIALVVAIGVLLVLAVLAAGVATVTLATKNQTSADRRSVRALAAADSGLRIGALYLNEATPITDGWCPGTAANAVATKIAAVSGQCGPYTVTLPTGGTATFTITGGATSAIACSGAQVNAPTRPKLVIHQRCITSTGNVGGALRRVQARLASASYIFPIPGILGLNGVKIGQGAGSTLTLAECAVLPPLANTVMASIGTNGTLTTALGCWLGDLTDVVNGNSSRLYMGKGAPAMNGSVPNPSITGAQPGGIVNLSYKLALPSVDPLFQTGQDGATDTSVSNNNSQGVHSGLTCTSGAYLAGRVLALPNNGCIVTLDGSNDVNHPKIYNFCGVSLPNNGFLSVTDPVLNPYVQVYIDSSARTANVSPPSPACTSTTTGTLTMGNGSGILANAGSSLGAQIFIYGTSDADGTNGNLIAWRNSADVKMLLVAPHAKIAFQNGGTITGGIAAYEVDANNNMIFIWDLNVDSAERRALYYRTSYTECLKAPSAPADPHSGC